MKKNPIYIAIINTDITPHNESVKLVYKWYQQIESKCDGKVVNTNKMDKETFFKTIKDLIGEHRTSCCMYICEHGKQEQKEDNTVEEYLKLNKKNAISDVEFTQFINELPILQKYIMMEVCHSGGLLNDVKCDTNQNVPINTMVLSLCSKDEKCYYHTIYKEGVPYTYCYYSIFFAHAVLNPLKEPLKAMEVLRRNKKFNIHPKLILINEDF